jgi:type II secretory pathway component GspD/PulD (secretin)
MKIAKESGGLDEIAVKGSALYVKNAEGQVGTINLSEYKKHADKLKVLTVSELMNERQNNPLLVGRNDLFDVANTSIGLEKITNTIKELISAISLEKIKDEKIYPRAKFEADLQAVSGVKPSSEQAKAMEQLKIVLSNPSEYYKVTTETSSKRRYLETAYDYL